MNSTTEYKTTRAAAYGEIVAAIARGLPAPVFTNFSDRPGQGDYMSLQLSTAEDFDVWCAELGGKVWAREERNGDYVQSHAGLVQWRGWSVSLSVCRFDPVPPVAAAILTPDSPELPEEEPFTGPSDELLTEVAAEDAPTSRAGASLGFFDDPDEDDEGEPLIPPMRLDELEQICQDAREAEDKAARIHRHPGECVDCDCDTPALVRDEYMTEICETLSETKRYMQRLAAKDLDGFVAVIANDSIGNPVEIAFGIDQRIVFKVNHWQPKPTVTAEFRKDDEQNARVTVYQDRDGDAWYRNPNGSFRHAGTAPDMTEDELRDEYGPLVVVEYAVRTADATPTEATEPVRVSDEHRALTHPDPADMRIPYMCACGDEFEIHDDLRAHVGGAR
jgi:hypothetical protein